MRYLAVGFVWLSVLTVGESAWAGPWTRGAGGSAYAKISESVFVADSFVDASGRVVEGADYLGFSTALYAEIGLLEGLHLQGYLPYVVARNAFDDSTRFLNTGLGDALVALQWTPVAIRSLPWAVRLEAKAPLYDVGDIEGPLAMRFPAFGDGQLDLTAWLSAGASGRLGVPLYGFLELGYRHRTEAYLGTGDDRAFADTLVAAAQLGATPLWEVLVALNVSSALPLRDDEVTRAFASVGPALLVPLVGGLSLEAGLDALFWTRNSAPGYSVGLGLSYIWRPQAEEDR